MIRNVVQQAFETRSLSSEAQLKIRDLLSRHCHLDDVDALIDLQQAINAGYIKQKSKIT